MRTLAATFSLFFPLACRNPGTAVTPAPPPNSRADGSREYKQDAGGRGPSAVKLAIALRNAGTLTQANTAVIETWCKSVQVLDDAIATELGSADAWATQKQKILLLVAGFVGPKDHRRNRPWTIPWRSRGSQHAVDFDSDSGDKLMASLAAVLTLPP